MGASMITRRAHAKVNLALSVGPPIPPPSPRAGYHPIASWMACIDLFDELTVTRLRDGEPSRHSVAWAPDAPRPSPIDWPIEKDLAVRAHRLLEGEAGWPGGLPLEMRLVKRTPVGGGLGGGSSDGAAALVAIRDLFGLPLGTGRLVDLSKELGSDVAFFLDERTPARPALVAGLGDRIERVGAPAAGQDVLLIIPPLGCPTGPVYKAFDRAPVRPLREADVRALINGAARTGIIPAAELFNDLGPAACEVEPRLDQMLRACRRGAGLPVHVTGSGSAMFILGEGGPAGALDRAAAAIASAAPSAARVRTRVL